MTEGSNSDATLRDLQRLLEESARAAESKPVAGEAAVEAMMSAARDLCEEPQNTEDLVAQEEATKMALSVLAERPGTGQVVIKYVDSNEEVRDLRFLIVLFGDRGFLFDRGSGRTVSVPLDDAGRSGSEREEAILESAKRAAAREGLSSVYLIRR